MIKNVNFSVKEGRGAASGKNEYGFLGGSIKAQLPFFKKSGLDISKYYLGTINADISPFRFRMAAPLLTINDVAWHPTMPAENFSFSPVKISVLNNSCFGLVYYPRPETKGAFTDMPPDNMIELLAPKIDGMEYGLSGVLSVDPKEIEIFL